MEHKHTKGPWEIYDWTDTGVRHIGVIDLAETGDICNVLTSIENDMRPESEVTANATLIAAAPDLLEALEKTAKSLEYHGRHALVDIAQAAINKARGN